MKEFYNNAYKIDSPHKYGGGKDGMPERTKKLLKTTSNFLKKTGLDDPSRGYEIVSHKNIMARLLAKGEDVVVSKLNK